uniref:Uncharacterized protein n=1 Tax=Rhizophora mucronata TaxID=61149 RepID=A0A2P2PUZ7_RHIMU
MRTEISGSGIEFILNVHIISTFQLGVGALLKLEDYFIVI